MTSNDLPRSGVLRAQYTRDVCSALAAYAGSQQPLHFSSERAENGSLTITFTMTNGDRYHELLVELMSKSAEVPEVEASLDGAR